MHLHRSSSLSVFVLLLAASCGGSVEVQPNSASAGSGGTLSAGGSGGSGGSTGTTPVPGTGGIGVGGKGGSAGGYAGVGGTGGSMVDAGAEASAVCGRTYAHFDLEVEVSKNQVHGCNVGKDLGPEEFKATLVSVQDHEVTLDTCPPYADCDYSITKIRMPSTSAFLPTGTFVTVYVHIEHVGESCLQRLMIVTLPEWGGAQNPNPWGASLLFAAADGTIETFDKAPFRIERQPQGCYPGAPSCGGVTPDDYLLRFFDAADPGTGVTVAMGGLGSWVWNSQGGYYAFQNLRSFASGACDDDANWAYTVSLQGIK